MQDINKLTIGDVGFSFNKANIFSRLINAISIWKKKLNKPAPKLSHCFIYIGDDLIAESTFGGVIIVNINKYFNDDHITEFQTPVISFTPEEQDKIFKLAAQDAGIVKYGYMQLFIILFNKWFKLKQFNYNSKQMQCSGFVSDIYDKLNKKLTDKDNFMNTPLDVYESEIIKDIVI